MKDIFRYKAELESKLEAVNKVIADMGLNEPPKHNEGSAMTQRQAILKAVTGGEAMRKSEIVKKASEIYGKSIKAINVAFHLAALKKEKIIVSPKQGWHQLAK